jgi:hypothetical protein
MGGFLRPPIFWPTNPNDIPIPPAASLIPTTLEELELGELAEMVFLLRLACGRSQLPLKNPKRALMCVLAAIVEYELYKRTQPAH